MAVEIERVTLNVDSWPDALIDLSEHSSRTSFRFFCVFLHYLAASYHPGDETPALSIPRTEGRRSTYPLGRYAMATAHSRYNNLTDQPVKVVPATPRAGCGGLGRHDTSDQERRVSWTAEKEWQEIVEIKGLVTDCQPHRSSRVSTAAVDRDLMPGDAEGIWRFGSRGR